MTWLWNGTQWRSGALVASTGTHFSPYFNDYSDFDILFYNSGSAPAAAQVPGVFDRFTTPYVGFDVHCSDANQTAWDPVNNRAVLVKKEDIVAGLGQTHDWRFYLYLPTQTIGNNYVLWEYHTGTSSGHHIGLNTDNTFRVARQSGPGQSYSRSFSGGPPVLFDTWQPIRLYIKWALDGTGFIQVTVNGTIALDYTGATLFDFANEGFPALQFGWYAPRPSGLTNEAKYGNIELTVS